MNGGAVVFDILHIGKKWCCTNERSMPTYKPIAPARKRITPSKRSRRRVLQRRMQQLAAYVILIALLLGLMVFAIEMAFKG